MAEAISDASKPDSRKTPQELINMGLRRAAASNSINVLAYLLHAGADVSTLATISLLADDARSSPSRETLQLLIDAGWDINTRGPRGTNWPLLLHVVSTSEVDLIQWMLDQGARVDIVDPPATASADGLRIWNPQRMPTLLDVAARSSDIALFDMLRDRGAPLGLITLHEAVRTAASAAPADGQPRDRYEQRLDMVRHLVDDVGLDVNAEVFQLGSMCRTPLSQVPGRPAQRDNGDQIRLLLDLGADECRGEVRACDGISLEGFSAFTCAESCRDTRFLEIVDEWHAQKDGRAK